MSLRSKIIVIIRKKWFIIEFKLYTSGADEWGGV